MAINALPTVPKGRRLSRIGNKLDFATELT